MEIPNVNPYQIPKFFTKFLLNAKYLHCCTIDRHLRPHVVPLVFVFDINQNLIFCVAGRNSTKVCNIQQNPYVTFTTDKTHPNNPLLNEGIMIETVVIISEDDDQIVDVMAKLQTKYKKLLNSKLLTVRVFESDILLIAHPLKMVHWRGPFFRQFVFKKSLKKRAIF
jgi:general stress protein 26